MSTICWFLTEMCVVVERVQLWCGAPMQKEIARYQAEESDSLRWATAQGSENYITQWETPGAAVEEDTSTFPVRCYRAPAAMCTESNRCSPTISYTEFQVVSWWSELGPSIRQRMCLLRELPGCCEWSQRKKDWMHVFGKFYFTLNAYLVTRIIGS